MNLKQLWFDLGETPSAQELADWQAIRAAGFARYAVPGMLATWFMWALIYAGIRVTAALLGLEPADRPGPYLVLIGPFVGLASYWAKWLRNEDIYSRVSKREGS